MLKKRNPLLFIDEREELNLENDLTKFELFKNFIDIYRITSQFLHVITFLKMTCKLPKLIYIIGKKKTLETLHKYFMFP
jgi:hypothetical protein